MTILKPDSSRSELSPLAHAVFATVLLIAATIAYTYHTPDFKRFLYGYNDFAPLYWQACNVGSGRMFEADIAQLNRDGVVDFDTSVFYRVVRFPWQAFLWSPLCWMPYLTSYWVWIGFNIAAFALLTFIFLAPRGYALWGALYFPAAASIVVAQDSLMLSLCLAGVLILSKRGSDVGAGLLLALCTAKPHLFLLVPVALATHRRWRMIVAAAVGAVGLFLMSGFLEGRDWPLRIIENVSAQESAADVLAPYRPSVFQFGVTSITIASALAVLLLCAVCIWRSGALESGLAMAIIGSILVAPHVAIYDLPLLLVALVALSVTGKNRWLRIVLLTPAPYWGLLNGSPWNVALPILMIMTIVGAVPLKAEIPPKTGMTNGA